MTTDHAHIRQDFSHCASKSNPTNFFSAAGLVSIGCLVGSLMAGPIMDRFGRRFALMVVSR